jgi:hypothetical protein
MAYPCILQEQEQGNQGRSEKLRFTSHIAAIWEELPSDTFIGAGTSVRTVLLMLDA